MHRAQAQHGDSGQLCRVQSLIALESLRQLAESRNVIPGQGACSFGLRCELHKDVVVPIFANNAKSLKEQNEPLQRNCFVRCEATTGRLADIVGSQV